MKFPVTVVMTFALIIGPTERSYGASFQVSFDASTSTAPPEFFVAFSDAIKFYELRFIDPITVDIQVGWGEVNGRSLTSGDIGQSVTNQRGSFTYAQVKSALVNDSKTNADAVAVANFRATDPTAGAPFVMSNAEAKALGLLAGNALGIDGWMGFSSTAPFTFDPGNRSSAGQYDFIGLAEHEISEVMGRYGMTQNGANGRYSPLDLFRYSSPGSLDLAPQNAAYFSIDGGRTAINVFNGPGRGDLSDWMGLTPDSYNAFLTLGRELDVSAGDITEMDAIGYDAVSEPTTLVLTGVGCIMLLFPALRRAVGADRYSAVRPRRPFLPEQLQCD